MWYVMYEGSSERLRNSVSVRARREKEDVRCVCVCVFESCHLLEFVSYHIHGRGGREVGISP